MRDDSGIPHVYGDSMTDLARAQGYVHAQERFFEMDLRRHITAGRLAELVGADGLDTDKVIRTMRDTGADMKAKYKETSRGGLAVNVIEC